MNVQHISRRLLLGATASGIIIAGHNSFAAATTVAETTTGKIAGSRSGAVHIFKGVPYGAPTGGANRFMPPAKPAAWTGTRDATMLGARCPQFEGTGSSPISEEAADAVKPPMSEDCLFLNVWTAGLKDNRKRPVMVFFHGGGFASGHGGNTRYDGTNLAAKHDVVAVTVNHRLNIFGFLYLGGIDALKYADSANVGMLDCVAALNWVKENIANFGGDSGNVTIFGQSGGSGKVTTMMGMPSAKGLFQRVIAQSGLDVRRGNLEDASRATATILKKLEITAGNIDTLQVVPPEKLLAALRELKAPLRPTPDGRGLPETPFDPVAPAMSSDVPLMIGSLLTETTYMSDTPLEPVSDDDLAKLVKEVTRNPHDTEVTALISIYRRNHPEADTALLYQLISTDFSYTSGVAVRAERKAALGAAPAYVYHFEKQTPVFGGKYHTPHTLDLAYAFDNIALSTAITGPGKDCQPLANIVSRIWTGFAKSGNPNVDGIPMWPAYEAQTRPVMILNDTPKVAKDPRREERVAIAAMKTRG